jgi:hypothetical protein
MALMFLCLVSCNSNQPTEDKKPKEEVPVALQDSKLKSISRPSDLAEALYQELVKNDPVLQKMEADFEALPTELLPLKEKYDAYEAKSDNYYASAQQKAAMISDSVLRAKVKALIAASESRYTSKTAELNSLLKELAANNTALTDYHAALKVALTLPVIEKFQADEMPDKKPLKELKKKQQKLLSKTDSLAFSH